MYSNSLMCKASEAILIVKDKIPLNSMGNWSSPIIRGKPEADMIENVTQGASNYGPKA